MGFLQLHFTERLRQSRCTCHYRGILEILEYPLEYTPSQYSRFHNACIMPCAVEFNFEFPKSIILNNLTLELKFVNYQHLAKQISLWAYMWHEQEEWVGCRRYCFWDIGINSVQILLFYIVFSIYKLFITL